MNEEYNEHNDIIGNFYNNKIIIGGFKYNNIISDFYNNTLNKYATYNNILNDINDINFGTSSLIYDNYNCNIFKNSGGTLRLSYYNESDVLTITDVVEISVPSNYITFVDKEVERICVANWGDGIGLTYEQAAQITTLDALFCFYGATPPNQQIISFNELQYFISVTELVTTQGMGTFAGDNQLIEIALPPNLIKIGSNAFNQCSNLSSIIIPNSVNVIDASAFYQCSELTSIIIPNSYTYIGEFAFKDCAKLTSISVGDFYGFSSFKNCSGLISIIVNSVNPPTITQETFEGCNNLLNIYVPSESVNAYKVAAGWSEYASIISAI